MGPDRDEIVRDDFPRVAQGWDPDAVRAHLRAVADALERTATPLAEVAAERVASVIEAAERKAAEIEAEARAKAEGIVERGRLEVRGQADRMREAVEGIVTAASEFGDAVAGPIRVPEPQPEAAEEPAPIAVPDPAPRDDGEIAAARLVAMKMALDGAPRAEVARHLGETYAGLAAPGDLVDDVFAKAGR